MKILIVEDDVRVGRFVEKGLREQGYTVSWVRSCKQANDALADDAADAIVLDLGLPDGDGLDLLAQWRGCGFSEPVIILSARDAVGDRVKGLNVGADDYLPKPFSFEELLARLRSLMRRTASEKKTLLEHGGVQMDLLGRIVRCQGQRLELTNREYALLEVLMLNKGRVITRTQIAEKIWEASYDMQTNLIDVYVRKLRKHFEAIDGNSRIKTVRGVGYTIE